MTSYLDVDPGYDARFAAWRAEVLSTTRPELLDVTLRFVEATRAADIATLEYGAGIKAAKRGETVDLLPLAAKAIDARAAQNRIREEWRKLHADGD